ncbi:hypothetical protein MGWOODY_Smn3203 [hydrothermal vent metagenome]|uniref:Uncharacterized protein n=1 Tax=hydrothermal vent metagenome TaxID=652676 RepID=A0A160TQD4_9ZZZZ
MKLLIHWRNRPTGRNTSTSHSPKRRSHAGGSGGGGARVSEN